MNPNIPQELFEQIFKSNAIQIKVFLRKSKSKGEAYDKFRDVGYEKTLQNAKFITALTRIVSSNSLIIRELGLTESGAIQIIIEEKDVPTIKLAEKITIDNVIYTPRHKALGNRFSVEKVAFGFFKIILFRVNE